MMIAKAQATDRLIASWWTLKISYGMMSLIIGVDKFLHLLVEWSGYTAPVFARLMPFSPTLFMHIVAVLEIMLGLAVLTRWTRCGALTLGFWLLAVTINMVAAGYYDIALRDWVLTAGAFALALLTPAAQAHHAKG